MAVSVNNQIRYMIQWFEEWSELQRSDFVPVMAEYIGNKSYVNGIVNSIANVNCQDKPMSLFQCRIKLFKEWVIQWSEDQKQTFMSKIVEIDEEFADKLTQELESVKRPEMNGIPDEEILED